MTESEIFMAASQIESPQLRAAFLDSVCRDKADLRKRIEDLLGRFDKWEGAVGKMAEQLPQRLGQIRNAEPTADPSQSTSDPLHYAVYLRASSSCTTAFIIV